MSGHTPTPWSANLPELSDGTLLASHIVDAEGIAVAQLAHHADDTIRANAAFIVRAVNCHDELVIALEALVSQIDKNDFRDSLGHDAKMLKAFIEGRAALAKARGEAL